MSNIRISLGFDMRAPDLGTPTRDLYAAAVEMAAFADEAGIDSINLMEHHASEDGYLPQPFLLGSAMAAVTKRIHFMLGAVILPLHDPVDMAERVAVLDLISGGRFNVIFGAGYVPGEFAMFGKSLKDRAKLMDEGIETILKALDGESFDYQGRPVFVRPLPTRDPRDIVMVGGGVPASARRAAKYDVGFGPMRGDIVDIYLEECEKHGRSPRMFFRPGGGMPLGIHLCEDPEAGWAALEPHALHVVKEYATWAAQEGDGSNSPFKGLDNAEALRASGLFVAWTPETLVQAVRANPEINNLGLQPLLGGLSPEEGWKSLRLLKQVLPELRGE
jgi:alkanesulfonate monooxygenase SsuD/methylene tetrahydromethanopterin reductase-like flavin-dependent oxidoreductase (luciferase family)